MNTELFDAFSLLMVRNHKYMKVLFNEMFSSSGLNFSSVICIRIIADSPDGVTLKELCSISCFDKALISRTVKDLTEKGYICRNPNDANRLKFYRLILTDKGKQTVKNMEERIYEFAQTLSDGLSDEDIERVYEAFARASDNLYAISKKISGRSETGSE